MATYHIVPERSRVWIEARSSVHPIHSEMSGLTGWLELEVDAEGHVDLAVTPAAQLSLPVDRLRSGNPFEERELRRRIDARRYPTIDGELTALAPGAGEDRFAVQGDVTFRGMTRPHEDEVTITRLDERTVQVDGRSRFDVRQFGMEPPRILMLRVEPEVDVRVSIVAERG